MIQAFLFFMTMLYSTVSIALLPPYYESAKEITAILNDSRVGEKITSGRLIQSIVKTETGYLITAGECTLSVDIHYLPLPAGFVGPANFEIESGEITCKSK